MVRLQILLFVILNSTVSGHGMRRPKQKPKSPASDFCLDDVCKPGHTLLWDLVQDNMVVRVVTISMTNYTINCEGYVVMFMFVAAVDFWPVIQLVLAYLCD